MTGNTVSWLSNNTEAIRYRFDASIEKVDFLRPKSWIKGG